MAGLRVDWTWDYGHTTKKTSALTNAQGIATSSRLVTSSTTFDTVKIAAHTVSASRNRYSNASFTRAPGGTAHRAVPGLVHRHLGQQVPRRHRLVRRGGNHQGLR